MWEFPSAEGKTPEEALGKLEKSYKTRATKTPSKDVRHQITHHKIKLGLYRAAASKTLPAGSKWVTPDQLLALPFSSAQSKLRDWVLGNAAQEPAATALPGPLFEKNRKRK
jgi:adenine-specific DNA glycosylase